MRFYFRNFYVFILAFGNLSLLAGSQPWTYNMNGGPEDTECTWIKNKHLLSGQINQRRKIIESCLFDDIKKKFKETTIGKRQLKLTDPPPITWGTNKTVQVLVHDITIRKFQGHNRESSMNSIGGSARISWIDSRLHWDSNEWHVESMPLEPYQIWEPERDAQDIEFLPSPSNHILISVGVHTMNLQDIKTDHNGNVTATLTFHAQVECSSNEYYYPTETVQCCLDFKFLKTRNTINTYKIASGSKKLIGKFDEEYSQESATKFWQLSNVVLEVVEGGPLADSRGSDDNHPAALKLCLEAERSSAVLKMELTWPAAASAVAFLMAPLFRTIRVQIYARMFAVLLQILCMQRLYEQHELNYLSKVPKIFLFYELTIIFTLVSFTLTLILLGLRKNSKGISSIRPPEHLLKVTNFLDRFWHFAKEKSEAEDYVENRHADMIKKHVEQQPQNNYVTPKYPVSENTGQPVASENKEENFVAIWQNQFLALNELSHFFLSILYIITISFLLI